MALAGGTGGATSQLTSLGTFFSPFCQPIRGPAWELRPPATHLSDGLGQVSDCFATSQRRNDGSQRHQVGEQLSPHPSGGPVERYRPNRLEVGTRKTRERRGEPRSTSSRMCLFSTSSTKERASRSRSGGSQRPNSAT